MDEVARHNHAQDLWIVIHDAVYDITKFFKEHPGGEEVLLQLGGQDATECFDSIGHSQEAINLRESFKIGKLGKSSGGSETKTRMKTTITKTTGLTTSFLRAIAWIAAARIQYYANLARKFNVAL